MSGEVRCTNEGPLVYSETGLMGSYSLKVNGNSFVQVWKKRKNDPRNLVLLTTIYINQDNDIATVITNPSHTTAATATASQVIPTKNEVMTLNEVTSGMQTRSGKCLSGKNYEAITPTTGADPMQAFAQLLGK